METVQHGTETYAAKSIFYMDRGHLCCRFPSGRVVTYRNARVEMLIPGWAAMQGLDDRVPTVVYDSPRYKRGFLYGSKMAENIVQGTARDLLAYCLVCLEQRGFKPFLHVHDEAVCEADPSRFREFMEIMSSVPSWCAGMPHKAEGYTGPLWTKQTDGLPQLEAMCGRILEHA
jgi:DNA polymerase